MKFNPEAKRPNFLLPKGTYPAQIEGAEEKTSKAGNPMLVVELRVFNGESSKLITDYIVTGGEYSMDWKIAHLMRSVGDDPAIGEVDAATLAGRNCTVKVRIKPAKGDYPEDNAIDDYLEGASHGPVNRPAVVDDASMAPF
jgi:hypothetical protein